MRRLLVLAFGVVSYGIFLVTFLYLDRLRGQPADDGARGRAARAARLGALLRGRGTRGDAAAARARGGPGAHRRSSACSTAPWRAAASRPGSRAACRPPWSAACTCSSRAWCWRCCCGSGARCPRRRCGARSPARPWPSPDAVFAAGFGLVLASTFLINHFNLFGLQQVWLQFVGRTAQEPSFRTPLFYRFVRHPLYLGFLIAFWATPRMTLGHLVFALGMSSYIVLGATLEERTWSACTESATAATAPRWGASCRARAAWGRAPECRWPARARPEARLPHLPTCRPSGVGPARSSGTWPAPRLSEKRGPHGHRAAHLRRGPCPSP